MANRNIDIRVYSIESGIPIAPRGLARAYPFATMDIGDSFPLKDNDFREVDRVRAAVQQWQMRHKPMKFAVRRVSPADKSYRCWRIA